MPRGCPRPKGPENPVFCDSPPLGVQSVKTQIAEKLRNSREKLLGRLVFSPNSAPSSGKSCFSVFGPSPEFPQVPKQAKMLLNHRFRPVGVRPKKKLFPRKLRETIPDGVVTFFSPFSGPLRSAVQKGPYGACCLLDAQAPPWCLII